MRNILAIFIIFIFGFMMSYVVFGKEADYRNLDPDEKQHLIVTQRDEAIKEAVKRGEYRCCIDPACTMCYMEANKWNNFKAGTCACDDFIARGEEPCPQCKRGLGDNASCDTSIQKQFHEEDK